MENQTDQARKMDAIATLAGGIAHQFNNKLFGILGNIELLRMTLPHNEKIEKHLELMTVSANMMSHLTNQLLAFAQGGKYVPTILSLTDFVKEFISLRQTSINRGIRVEIDLSPNIFDVKVDRTQMKMVLYELLANAQEAIDAEGVIHIATRNAIINEGTAKGQSGIHSGGYACLSVKDNGKGMDAETKKRIFEPFFSTKFVGRGLGMAAVYGIVKNHAGYIRVDSETGKGTAVFIYLPKVCQG